MMGNYHVWFGGQFLKDICILLYIYPDWLTPTVNYGWLIRYCHANGAGFFFIFVYLHMARGIYYGSYRKPRIALWTIGVIIFLLMIITAFMGKLNNSPKSKYQKNNLNNKRLYSTNTKSPNLKSQDLTNPTDVIYNILGNTKLVFYWENLHKHEIKEDIFNTVKNKSGIYIIINKITHNFYIGSANPNRLYTKFSNHLIHLSGNKQIKKSIQEYGLNNFIFGILEFINIQSNPQLQAKILYKIEISYISLLAPTYNISIEASKSLGLKSTEESRIKLQPYLIKERQELLKKLQKNKLLFKNIINNSEKLQLFNLNNIKICEFNNINKAANYLCCSIKIIKRTINKGYIYIPNQFIPYLTMENIKNNNSIKNIKNFEKLKSGLLLTENKTKFIIKYEKI